MKTLLMASIRVWRVWSFACCCTRPLTGDLLGKSCWQSCGVWQEWGWV